MWRIILVWLLSVDPANPPLVSGYLQVYTLFVICAKILLYFTARRHAMWFNLITLLCLQRYVVPDTDVNILVAVKGYWGMLFIQW